MADLKKKFSRKQWKDCCGKGCKKCSIAQAYTQDHGRKEGLEALRADRRSVLVKKDGGKKAGKKKSGKKAGKGKS